MNMEDCEFCGCRLGTPEKRYVDGAEVLLCRKCAGMTDSNKCFVCEEVSDPLINGRCIACSTLAAARAEKRRHEIANGLGVDALEMLTRDVVFTEEDYERWLAFGQGNFKPSNTKTTRKIWLHSKVVKDSGWSEQEFQDNIDTLTALLERNKDVFASPCRFMLYGGSGKSKKIVGTVIDKEKNVYLMEV